MNENAPTVRRATRKRPMGLLALAGAVGATALTGCGSPVAATGSSAQPSSAMSMPATATTIMIENSAYQIPGSVRPGATVRVMNMDGQAHTVTADKNAAFAVTVPADTTASFTAPATAGTYDFHGDDRSNMHGTLVVK